MKSRRPLTVRLIALVLGCAAGLVVAEGALRLIDHRDRVAASADPAETYDLGRLGYNDGSVRARKAPGEYRILSFGDSFTYSITPNAASWNGVAGRQLSAAWGRPVRVVNLGVRARSFPTYVRQWRYWAPRLEHDAVLFDVYVGNDLADLHAYRHVYRRLAPGAGDETPGLASGDVYLRTGAWIEPPDPLRLRLVDAVRTAWRRWTTRLPGAEDYLDTTQMPMPTYAAAMGAAAHPYRAGRDARAATRDGWVAAVDLLDAAREATAGGRRAVVLLSPPALFFDPVAQAAVSTLGIDVGTLDRDRPRALLVELARRIGASEVEIVDLLPCLARASEPADLYLGTNSHWTVRGNEVAGRCVAAALLVEDGARAGSPRDRAPAAVREPRRARSLAREAGEILRDRQARDRHRAVLRAASARAQTDAGALERTLEEAGLARAAGALRGSVDGLVRAGDTPNAPPAEAVGWAVAVDRPDARASVWVVADGRIVGFARTAGRRSDVAKALALPAGTGDFVAFTVPLALDCEAIRRGGRVDAYAISDDGRFAALPLAGPARCREPDAS